MWAGVLRVTSGMRGNISSNLVDLLTIVAMSNLLRKEGLNIYSSLLLDLVNADEMLPRPNPSERRTTTFVSLICE
jgi:hypothetical protein